MHTDTAAAQGRRVVQRLGTVQRGSGPVHTPASVHVRIIGVMDSAGEIQVAAQAAPTCQRGEIVRIALQIVNDLQTGVEA